MKKFKSIFALFTLLFLGFYAFARDPATYGMIYSVSDDNKHISIRPLSQNNPRDFTLTENTKYFDDNDEPIGRPDFKRLGRNNNEVLIHFNDKNEITEFYIMKPGYNSHEYYLGKGIDTKTVEGTYKIIWDGVLRMVPYGSKSVVEYGCGGAKLYNENNIEIRDKWDLLNGSSKIRVVLEQGMDGNYYARAIYMLPLQYDFKTKKIGGKAEQGSGKTAYVDDDGWGSDGDEEEWDGWSDTSAFQFDFTITEAYGYIKDVEYESIKITRKDGKYKNFKPYCGGSQCIIYKEDGKKTSVGSMRWKSGQYCRYLVKKYTTNGEEGIVEIRILPEGTKFEQDRFVPDNLEEVKISSIKINKNNKSIYQIKLSLNQKWMDCQIDGNTRFYDECQRQTTFKDIVTPYKASYYELDGKIYLYDVYAKETWSSLVK